MAYRVMAYVVMAYRVMAYTVMAKVVDTGSLKPPMEIGSNSRCISHSKVDGQSVNSQWTVRVNSQ